MTDERIEPYCCSSLAWSMREQAPQDHGTCDIQAHCSFGTSGIHVFVTPNRFFNQVVSAVYVTEAEADQIVLDPKEYSESGWYRIDEVAADTAKYHPCLRRAAQELITLGLHRKMEAVMLDGGSDTELAAATKAYLEAKQKAKVTECERSAYVLRNEALDFETYVDVRPK